MTDNLPQRQSTPSSPIHPNNPVKLVGISLGGAAAVAGLLAPSLSSPQAVVTWVDAIAALVGRLGMPGVILALCAVVYYQEFIRIPKIHEQHRQRESDHEQAERELRNELRDEHRESIRYRDSTQGRMEEWLEDSVRASTRLEGTLNEVRGLLERKRGSNGST